MNEQDAQTYLNLGISADEVVKLRWPDISEEWAAHILWEHTPFPLSEGVLDIVEAVADLPEDCECGGPYAFPEDPWHNHTLDAVMG